MFVCCECSVLSVRGLCDEPITRPAETYRMCDREASIMRPRPTGGGGGCTIERNLSLFDPVICTISNQ